MQQKGYRRLALIGSTVGAYGMEGISNYGAANADLIGLRSRLPLEGAQHGILVNCVLPQAHTALTSGRPKGRTLRASGRRGIFHGRRYLFAGFTATTRGWTSPHDDPSADDIRDNLATITELDEFNLPKSAPDEMHIFASRRARAPGKPV
jgi:NAD(P)-dependent dehydrogenase (short-subunit alcohol dehydrogenase family)